MSTQTFMPESLVFPMIKTDKIVSLKEKMHHRARKPCPIVVKYELGCTYLRYVQLGAYLNEWGYVYHEYFFACISKVYIRNFDIYWVCILV
jgi:hypothetical protein